MHILFTAMTVSYDTTDNVVAAAGMDLLLKSELHADNSILDDIDFEVS